MALVTKYAWCLDKSKGQEPNIYFKRRRITCKNSLYIQKGDVFDCVLLQNLEPLQIAPRMLCEVIISIGNIFTIRNHVHRNLTTL